MATTARAVERNILFVAPSGDDYLWYFEVLILNLGGSTPNSGNWTLETITVTTNSPYLLPATATRAAAYRDFANNYAGAANTVPLLGCQLLTWAVG